MSTSITGLRILPAETDYLSSVQSGNNGTGFEDMLKEAVDQVDSFQSQADQRVGDLLTGRSTDVHSATIAVEKADLSFQLMMQVRNKVVQAYQEVERMQF